MINKSKIKPLKDKEKAAT